MEFVIYIAILSVITNMAMISFRCIERQKLINAAKTLKTNLEYCQLNAITEKRNYELVINAKEKDFYYIKRADDNGTVKIISKIVLSPGIKIDCNANNGRIAYTTRGTTSFGAACTINLKSNRYYLPLTINVGCGRVKIKSIKKLEEKPSA